MPDKPPTNQGDDISGVVHEVGEGVSEFKKGDRVAAFHEMMKPGGSYAEYALSWASTTFKLPPNTSFEGTPFPTSRFSPTHLLTRLSEGAALPLAALTAACGLYAKLRLPPPWLPATSPIPLVIYGASSAVGYYTIQFAKKSNTHPLICVAGKAQEHVESVIERSKGDTIVDYRQGDEAVVKGLKDALGAGQKLEYAFDAVSEKGSYQNICKVLDASTGSITFVLPGKTYDDVPSGVKKSNTRVGDVHGTPDDLWEFGFVFSRYIAKGLEEGWFRAQPQEVVPGGLGGVEEGLRRLKEGKASAVKYIFRIGETEGLGGA